MSGENQNPIQTNSKNHNGLLICFVIVLIISLIIFCCCGVYAFIPFIQGMQKAAVEDSTLNTNTTSSTVSSKQMNSVNQEVNVNKMLNVTLVNVDNNYKVNQRYLAPTKGNKYIAVEVNLENTGSNKPIYYSPAEWTLVDENNYVSNSYSALEQKEPKLPIGYLAKGSTVRGWITFQVPESSKELTLVYLPSISNETVEFKIQ